ncbi:MAG: hypothetical protein BRD47_07755 [Bacteroidetes bacterium QS_8_68_28]|nr:MAG: hypothetical protein BRD47_07755 [Bacteroidetes bacterium QS_8_68_28]
MGDPVAVEVVDLELRLPERVDLCEDQVFGRARAPLRLQQQKPYAQQHQHRHEHPADAVGKALGPAPREGSAAGVLLALLLRAARL